MLSNDAKVLVGCIESSSASVTGLFCFKPSEHLFYPQHERCPLAPVAHPVIGLGIPQLTSEACPSSNYRLIQNVRIAHVLPVVDVERPAADDSVGLRALLHLLHFPTPERHATVGVRTPKTPR